MYLLGVALPEVLDEYKSVNADLNVMPFCSQFIPLEVIEYPELKSICYHPSLLPRHRGASAISWTLIQGDVDAGFTVFWPDDGLDTGDILLQRRCRTTRNDTVDSLYKRFMYPEGVEAMAEAVEMVAAGIAPKVVQPECGATYDPMMNKAELCEVDLGKAAKAVHDFIRGLDSVPGAWVTVRGQEVKLFGSKLWTKAKPKKFLKEFEVEGKGRKAKGFVHNDGFLIEAADGKFVNVKLLKVDGKFVQAEKFGDENSVSAEIVLTDDELKMKETLAKVWMGILKTDSIQGESTITYQS